MMKKVVTLVLVLCLVSMANAALVRTLTVGGADAGAAMNLEVGSPIVIGVDASYGASDAPLGSILKIANADAAEGAWSGRAIYAAAGDTAAWNLTTPANANYVQYTGAPAIGSWADGIQIDATFTGSTLGTTLIELRDYTGALLDSLTITQVPEPATMALLGLGGLLLRRKK